jgi:hypothetical protein
VFQLEHIIFTRLSARILPFHYNNVLKLRERAGFDSLVESYVFCRCFHNLMNAVIFTLFLSFSASTSKTCDDASIAMYNSIAPHFRAYVGFDISPDTVICDQYSLCPALSGHFRGFLKGFAFDLSAPPEAFYLWY